MYTSDHHFQVQFHVAESSSVSKGKLYMILVNSNSSETEKFDLADRFSPGHNYYGLLLLNVTLGRREPPGPFTSALVSFKPDSYGYENNLQIFEISLKYMSHVEKA